MSLEKKEVIVKGKKRIHYFFNDEKITKKKYDILSQDIFPDDKNLTFEDYMVDPIMIEFYESIINAEDRFEAIEIINEFCEEFKNSLISMSFISAFREQAELLDSIADQIEDGELDIEEYLLGEEDLEDEE